MKPGGAIALKWAGLAWHHRFTRRLAFDGRWFHLSLIRTRNGGRIAEEAVCRKSSNVGTRQIGSEMQPREM